MGKKAFFIALLVLCLLYGPCLFSQSLSYDYLIDLGKQALSEADYEEAIHYFNLASMVDSSSEEAIFYTNLAKRLKDGRIERIPSEERVDAFLHKKEMIDEKADSVSETLDLFETMVSKEDVSGETIPVSEKKRAVAKMLDDFEKKILKKQYVEEAPVSFVGGAEVSGKKVVKRAKTVVLDESLWKLQPATIEIEVGSSVLFKGKNIKRFLVVFPDVVSAEKVDAHSLLVTAHRVKGSTFMHIWDDSGRWTFKIKVIFPVQVADTTADETIEEVAPFVFGYDADWSSFYRGTRTGTLNRLDLSLTQRLSVTGPTPYGDFDTSARFTKFDESTEATSYTVGLSDGKFWNFKKFNIRGFDLYEFFSPLTLAGEGVRGAKFGARAFNDTVAYDVFWGRERVIFGFTTPGARPKLDSFLEGVKVTFFPEEKSNISLNAVRGYGLARPENLKERVFSVEAQHYVGDFKVNAECAFDEERIAALAYSSWAKDDLTIRLNARNIESGFTTISGSPGDQGELGALIGLETKIRDIRIATDLDIYRDRLLFNPSKPRELNYEWNTFLDIPLTEHSKWRTSSYYMNTPGLISPWRSVRITNTYNRSFKFFNRSSSFFIGNNYQKNRFPLSPSSDFDRFGFDTGFRFNLFKNFSYFINYDYSWVKEVLTAGKSSPRVMRTGFTYYRQLTKNLTCNTSLSYRDEEDAQGTKSFLAGEDSLYGTLGFSYKPRPGFEIFANTVARNVWAERADRDPFNEVEIRFGVRSDWDMPFRWNPKGEIHGIVFADLNGNATFDEEETGLSGITVKIGDKAVTTDDDGFYRLKIGAKKVLVQLDVSSIPQGFVFSTATSYRADIEQKKSHTVNFGLTTQSGIYGVVYYDENANGKPDANDKFIPQAKIVLDGSERVTTDSQGSYFFRNISAGIHSIALDVNSLPIEYIPLIKVRTKIDLKEGTTHIFHIPLKKKGMKQQE